jgi:hypothetical protein
MPIFAASAGNARFGPGPPVSTSGTMRPEARLRDVSGWLTGSTMKAITEASHNLGLLAILVLVPARNPVAAGCCTRHATDTNEHKPGRHDERRRERDKCPGPTRGERRPNVAREQRKRYERTERSEPLGPVNRVPVRDRNESVPRQRLGEWASVKSAEVWGRRVSEITNELEEDTDLEKSYLMNGLFRLSALCSPSVAGYT